MKTSRGLSAEFMNELLNGFLTPILKLVQNDDTLSLQIRNDYLNIYYRGGNILKLTRKNNSYLTHFENKYSTDKIKMNLPNLISIKEDSNRWAENIPLLKQIMDIYFTKHSKSEREFQQLVARENNNSIISNDTDYFITDLEYSSTNSRFDLIGIKWKSSSSKRKNVHHCQLILIEMKYGDAALGGTAGIKKHLDDIEKFCGDTTKLENLKEETISAFKQLRELDLIQFGDKGNNHQIEQLRNEKPEFIFLFANHKPAKGKLSSEFQNILDINNADVRIATANFMGYGLYHQNMLTIEEFKKIHLHREL